MIFILNGGITSLDLSDYEFPNYEIIVLEDHDIVTALNAGLDKSKSGYIARIDVGDLWKPQHLELLVNYLETHKETDLVSTTCIPFDDYLNLPSGNADFREMRDPFSNYSLLFNRNWVNHPGVLYRNTKVRYVDLIPRQEDWLMWITLANEKNLALLNNETLFYFIGDKVFNFNMQRTSETHEKFLKYAKEVQGLSNSELVRIKKYTRY